MVKFVSMIFMHGRDEGMNQVINWKDNYTDTRYRKILTSSYLDIPGLQVLAKQVRISATESLPLHFHENSYELVYITSGTPSFFVDDKTYNLCGGDVFITQPNQMHSTNSVPVTVSEMYWLQFELDPGKPFLHLDSTAVLTLHDKFAHIPSPKISTTGSEIHYLFKNAFQIALEGSNPQLVSQYIALLLYRVVEFSEQTAFRLTPDIGFAMNYILDHITEPLTLDEVARQVYLSTSQFKQKFKKQLGISPRQFINSQKIEYAKSLLDEGSSVEAASNALNFSNSSYFTSVFKKFCSYTPPEYKTAPKTI